MFSNNRAVNVLAAARILLFASRDVWFVVGLPVFLRTELGWSFWQVGAFLAVWVIGYGVVQAVVAAPAAPPVRRSGEPTGRTAAGLAFVLAAFPAAIAVALAVERRSGTGRRARADRVRHRVRAQLGRALVPDPRATRRATRSR